MNYKSGEDKSYKVSENGKIAAKARAYGDKNDNTDLSVLEVGANAGAHLGPLGGSVVAKAETHVFNFKDEQNDIAVRAFGTDIHANAGIDFEAFAREGHTLGAEISARTTMVECKAGPIGLHIGAGVTTAAKIEDGTVHAKLAGCGFKVGKTIGVSVFDNEFSLDLPSVFKKILPW